MKSFDLNAITKDIYSAYPEAERKPLIGITANYTDGDASLRDRYYTQIADAGGVPVIIPPLADKDIIINTLDNIDALLLTGGADHNPLWSGQQPQPGLHNINQARDLPELLATRLACNRQMPILGICRGMQTIAIALGGEVCQDIPHTPQLIKHSQEADRTEPTHSVDIEPDSALHGIFGTDRIFVNSFHHQAVTSPGKGMRITATAPDGTAEAMESTCHKPVIGVQWHPEWMGADGLPLFRWLVDEARLFSEAKRTHASTLTLDTHCDTPMFFSQGIRFEQRDPRILVDLHKMDDGRQDAVTMVAYLPQPAEGQKFADVAQFGTESPKDYADLIFDKIEDIVARNALHLSIARTPADLYEAKRLGHKSIMLGIENGLAIEDSLDNIDHFARRGIAYMTLCHNGDNAICDSARRSKGTHGGVSAFGAEVIRRMNDLGVMVDMSHAGEKSFYDALSISRAPIVCSHSNCRALCDVPRNLTDDQLRAIARKGGVVHITLYHGFLRTAGEASILDAIAHLEHAISIMGTDHVGIGTDFDGDGGVSGMADSSEMINFTRMLLRRRYSPEDIALIWGGNWLRVMDTVKGMAATTA
ncbi:membrane dipeptidase [Leyella lascolaii]|uniref:membrane dipeptidase n=1 Tax=Leyella lascolaii TaxID=1776379 RepID=UPI00294311DA|nr:membrane dipeptidase [Leyella lascolaii]